MIEIRPLTQLDLPRFRKIADGYTSPARYTVSKIETPERTVISLELTPIDPPYVKLWEGPQHSEQHYAEVVSEGLSLGAHDGERLVGLSINEQQRWNRVLLVREFHVDKEYRGQGIGAEMISLVVALAREAGLRAVVCETQNTNPRAINFYRRAGFEIDAVDLSLYSNHDIEDGEVAVFMKRKLD